MKIKCSFPKLFFLGQIQIKLLKKPKKKKRKIDSRGLLVTGWVAGAKPSSLSFSASLDLNFSEFFFLFAAAVCCCFRQRNSQFFSFWAKRRVECVSFKSDSVHLRGVPSGNGAGIGGTPKTLDLPDLRFPLLAI